MRGKKHLNKAPKFIKMTNFWYKQIMDHYQDASKWLVKILHREKIDSDNN